MYILSTITVQKSNRNSNFKYAVLLLKRRLLKIAKSPVLRNSVNDNSKSRYGSDLKFFMAFLDR